MLIVTLNYNLTGKLEGRKASPAKLIGRFLMTQSN